MRPSAIALLGSLPLFLLAGCGGEREVDRFVREGIFVRGNGAEPQSLDPHIVTGVPENRIISAIFEGLIAYHPYDDSLPEPGVAESWQPNEDQSVWTFRLREDARWSNGEPVTAHDFLFSFERILRPEFGAKYVDKLFLMKGAYDFYQALGKGEQASFEDVGAKALDDHTLRIELIGPTPEFLNILKHYAWFPVHPGTILKYGKMSERATAWTQPGNLVGNGPFVLTEWLTNKRIVVEKSPTYWDAERVQLNAMHFIPIENDSAEEKAFRGGRLHYAGTLPSALIQEYRQKHRDVLNIDPLMASYFYRLNVTEPPLDDGRVRQALAYALDRRSIVDNVTRGGQIPAGGLTPGDMGFYETPAPYDFNPEKARQLLAAAGYPNGEGFPQLELLFNTSEGHRDIAQAVQEMWRENLGIDIILTNRDWKVYITDQQNLNYQISRSGWNADYLGPTAFAGIFTTGNGNNNTGWSNAAFDVLIAQALREGDSARRHELVRQAEEILITEAPIIPLYWYTRVYLLDPRVRGWAPKLLDNHPPKYLYFADPEAEDAGFSMR